VSATAASGNREEQNLLADCVLEIEVEKTTSWQDRVRDTRDHPDSKSIHNMLGKRKKVIFDVEMQRASQPHIVTRLSEYVSHLSFGQLMIPVGPNKSIPFPVFGVALCMWGSESPLIRRLGGYLPAENVDDPSGTCLAQLRLGTLTKGSSIYDQDQRKELRKKLKKRIRKELIENFPIGAVVASKAEKNRNQATFSQLKLAPADTVRYAVRILYEWLCFFRCAPLMTSGGVSRLLSRSVKEAYNIMKIKEIKEDYALEQVSSIWDAKETEEKLSETEQKLAAEAEKNKILKYAIAASKKSTANVLPKAELVKIVEEKDLTKRVIKELKDSFEITVTNDKVPQVNSKHRNKKKKRSPSHL
jgi:hypothetical protein